MYLRELLSLEQRCVATLYECFIVSAGLYQILIKFLDIMRKILLLILIYYFTHVSNRERKYIRMLHEIPQHGESKNLLKLNS